MTTDRRFHCLRRLALLAPIALGVYGAVAQPGTLDPGIVSSNNLGSDAVAAVEAHARRWAPDLASADASAASQARDRLMAPLDSSGASVAFRMEYSRVLAPMLAEHAGSDEFGARLGAMRIAGKLATDQASQIVLEALGDEEARLRFGFCQNTVHDI